MNITYIVKTTTVTNRGKSEVFVYAGTLHELRPILCGFGGVGKGIADVVSEANAKHERRAARGHYRFRFTELISKNEAKAIYAKVKAQGSGRYAKIRFNMKAMELISK